MFKKFLLTLAAVIVFSTGNSYAGASYHEAYQEEDSWLESYNRAVFSFNNGFNHYVLMPVSRAYRAVTNQFFRNRVNGIINNLEEPLYAGNYLLQGEFSQSGVALSRFVINSTLGLFGMFDVAGGWGLENQPTSFDDTFATWCIPDGPFFMLPFLGPSTPRATAALALDFTADPVYWAVYQDSNVNSKISYTYTGIKAIAVMERNMDFLNDLEKNSVDFYSTMKSAYLQNRKNKGCFRNADENPAVSYDFDFDMEEEEEDIADELLVQPLGEKRSSRPQLLVLP